MRWRTWLLVPLMVGVMPASAQAAPPGRPSASRVRLRTFSSCTALVGYARRHLATTHGVPVLGVPTQAQPVPVGVRVGAPAPAAAPGQAGGTSFSATNDQEPGVDEPDIVKTDGTRIFSVVQNRLYAVTVGAGGPALAGSLDLGSSGYGAQLLLRGNRLIVISGSGPNPLVVGIGGARRGGPAAPAFAPLPPYYFAARTSVTEVDVHDPAAMTITRTMTIDGNFVAARQNGSTARLVVSSAPRAIAYPGARGRASGWVPTRRFTSRLTGRHYTRAVAACDTIRRPVRFSGLGMLTILTIDLDRGLYASDAKALMADAQVVYGSTQSMYVATERWIDPQTPAGRLPSSPTTVIDRFDVTDPSRTTYVASGEVPGYLLNQYSMSESNGYLRVATTSQPLTWSPGQQQPLSQSYVTVLGTRGSLLLPVGQVAGLGAGQSIRSVRFVGDAGYVVTFRQIDPLYTVDLSVPTAPRVAGQLELQGYSSYLHPVGNGLLLGIGQSVAANEPSGLQVELFNVADPAAPRLVARTALGAASSSEAQYDPHAFLYWTPTELAFLPVQIYPPFTDGSPPAPAPSGALAPADSGSGFDGAVGFHVDGSGISELGRVQNDFAGGLASPITRSLVIGDHLFTLSDDGLMQSSLATLARERFVAFGSTQLRLPGRPGIAAATSPPRRP